MDGSIVRGNRRIAFALLGLLTILGCWFLRRHMEMDESVDGIPGALSATAVVDRPVDAREAGESTEALGRVSAAPPVGERPVALRLQGSIVFLDSDGTQRPSRRGSIAWQLEFPDGSVTETKCGIRDDRWAMDVESVHRLRAIGASWSGDGWGQHAAVDAAWMSTEEIQASPIIAHLRYGCALRVIDAKAGHELRDIELALARVEFNADTRSPPDGYEARVTCHASSPVRLPLRPGVVAGWCRAPGYAWQRFSFEGEQGLHTVALSRGADLTVEVRDLPVDARRPTITVHELGAGGPTELAQRLPLAQRALDSESRAVFSGLPDGRILLVVGPPNPRPATARLAERSVELVAGREHTEIIDLSSAQDRLGALRVEVLLPPGPISNMTRVAVQRVGMERTLPVEHLLAKSFDAAGRAVIDLSGLSPGEHLVWLLPQCRFARATVAAGQTQEVTLVQTGSASVTVRLTHAGKPIPSSVATVLIGPSQIRHSGAYAELVEGRGPGVYSAAFAPGEYVLVATAPRLGAHSTTISLGEEPVHLDIELERSRTYVLRAVARHGSEDLLLPEAFWSSVGVLDARTGAPPFGVVRKLVTQQIGGLSNMDASKVEFTFQASGEYTLVFPEPSGMRAPEPVTVTLATEAAHEVPIHFEYE